MGDRSNVYIQDTFWEGAGIYLYSHWGGKSFQKKVLDVLDTEVARDRWGDSAYLGRILIQGFLDSEPFDSTGYGVSCRMPDNEHPILVLDTSNQKAALVPAGEEDKRLVENGISFNEACKIGFEDLASS